MSGGFTIARALAAGMWGAQMRSWDEPEIMCGIAGALAGAITATFVCPLDVLKTRLQVQSMSSSKYGGIFAGGLSAIVREEGMRGLYRGLSPTLLALLPNWAVYFTVYEKLKAVLSANNRNNRYIAATPALHMAAACGAGAATLLVTNPLWVIKTRLQTQNMRLASAMPGTAATGRMTSLYKGTADAMVRITREEGLRGLYSGLGASLMGICHVGIQFPLYEACKKHLADRAGIPVTELPPHELVVASALSKMVASTVTYPHEVVRAHMHINGTGPWSGLLALSARIYQADGLRGFYRGCGTNLLRTTPAAALTFTSFEMILRFLRDVSEKRRGALPGPT